MGLRLLLAGITESDDIEPYPIIVKGMDKPILSTKVKEYVNYEFWYYYQFYNNSKQCGPPFPQGWLDWPCWVVQLMTTFDRIIDNKKARDDYEFQAALHGAKIK